MERGAYKAPWGYSIDENLEYVPIEDELEVLEVVGEYIREGGLTYKEAALYISDETGRQISYEGLRKRLKRGVRLENSDAAGQSA